MVHCSGSLFFDVGKMSRKAGVNDWRKGVRVVQAVQSMLLPQEGSLSIHTSLPASGDGSSPIMAAVRLLAEIRTRSESNYYKNLNFNICFCLIVTVECFYIKVFHVYHLMYCMLQSMSSDGSAAGGQLVL